MRSLLVILLLSFLLSLFTFFSITAIIFYAGYKKSTASWSSDRRQGIEQQVHRELASVLSSENSQTEDVFRSRLSSSLPSNTSITVYDRNRNIVFKKRGTGMGKGQRMMQGGIQQVDGGSDSLVPVRVKGDVVGYFSIGSVHFRLERLNERFLSSMRMTIFVGVGCAFAIAILFALIISNRLAKSAKTVSRGINQMVYGNLTVQIPERGVEEIFQIAKSANELGSRLQEEENLRRQWAADIAHDLRTPISALKSQLEGMVDGVLDVTRDRIKKNMHELLRIEHLIDDLAELTRLESPEMKIHPVEINTDKLFGELKNRFTHEFKHKSITVLWENDVDSFIADEHLLLRAVSNFISNSIRHTPEGGEMRVAVRKDEKGFRFSVFNSGKGIPEPEINRVFDRLYRGEYARKTPGSGLGLTISQKIAELHGGYATIQSDEHRGTTVEMYIHV
jgi:two-component system sensor histidine kinase BaeS